MAALIEFSSTLVILVSIIAGELGFVLRGAIAATLIANPQDL
jgi:hypothetical protein